MKKIEEMMRGLTEEERTERMHMSIHWVCAVLEETGMDPHNNSIQMLLNVLFDLMCNQKEEEE